MRGVNRLIVVGRLGQDPELRTSKAGNPWCTFNVATNRSRKSGEQWVEETDWHRVKVFGTQAERCHEFLRRGSMVSVEGAVTCEQWTDDEGIKRSATRILAERVGFLSDMKASGAESAVPA